MNLSSETRLPAIEAWLRQLHPDQGPFALHEIVGGVSHRRFFRVRWNAERSAIAMLMPDSSPEMVRLRDTGRRFPFLEIQEFLASRGIRVPKLYAEASDQGLLLMEDLGHTLADHLSLHPEHRELLYRKAVRDLALAQLALSDLPEGCPVRDRAFDVPLLLWELEHFEEWGIHAQGFAWSTEDQQHFARAARYLAETIAGWPRGFVHRDYQSRNLMVIHPSPDAPTALALGWIDFQDAMLGPRAYDLVALLCDSYQDLDSRFIQQCLDEYADTRGLRAEERRALGREFALLTVQRKLKDAGRFVFIDRKKSDPSFLPFFQPTLAMVERALTQLRDIPELRPLEPILKRLQ